MTIVDKFLNFAWVAKLSTSRQPIFKGLLPSLQTMTTLLLVSLALASGVWLWTGAVASVAAFVPVFLKTIAAISGTALLNFWFNRDITTAVLNSREVRKGHGFEEEHVTKIRNLVDQVRCELNVHFREKYAESHVDLPMPRLCMYTFDKAKIQTVMGRTPDNAALFFSSTFFNAKDTRWNERHMAALVAHQLTQVYHRRGWSATFVSIASSFLSTLEALQSSEQSYFRALGVLAGPVQLFFFVQKAIERSYSYEAAGHVAEIGRGYDFFDAIDIKVCPSLRKQPAYSFLLFDQDLKKRPPYDGIFASWLRPWMDRIDSNELAGDNKNDNRFISAIDIAVRETIYSLQEMNSSEPRTTRLKDHLRDLFKLGGLWKEYAAARRTDITVQDFVANLVQKQVLDEQGAKHFQNTIQAGVKLNQLSPKMMGKVFKVLAECEMARLDRVDREINRRLYNAVKDENRIESSKPFESIGPDGNGKKPNKQAGILATLKAQVTGLENMVEQLLNNNLPPVVPAAPILVQQHHRPAIEITDPLGSDNDSDHDIGYESGSDSDSDSSFGSPTRNTR